MMPAISLNALPSLPPFQFLPEADLNFGAVLEAVPAQVSQVPAQPERALPDETQLSFLGINPVKAQPIAPKSPAIEDETLDDEAPVSTDPLSREGGRTDPIIDSFGLGTGLPPSQKNDEGLDTTVPPQAPNTPRLQPFGLSSSKPSLSFNLEEIGSTSTSSVRAEFGTTLSPEGSNTPPQQSFGLAPSGPLSKPSLSSNFEETGSTSTSSVQTELGGAAFPIIQSALLETKDSTPTQPTITAPSADPLRFVVERQLDLARDARWLDALARDIVAVAEAPDRLSFRLSPPQLGQLDVNLSSSDSGLSVRMNASTEAAAHIVAAAQPRLIDELKSQGVRVAEAHVSTGGGGSQGQGQPQQQRDADQMIEFARARFERANETDLTRPTGRFA